MAKSPSSPTYRVGSFVTLSERGIRFVNNQKALSLTGPDHYLIPGHIYTVKEAFAHKYKDDLGSYRLKERDFHLWPEDYLSPILEPDD